MELVRQRVSYDISKNPFQIRKQFIRGLSWTESAELRDWTAIFGRWRRSATSSRVGWGCSEEMAGGD